MDQLRTIQRQLATTLEQISEQGIDLLPATLQSVQACHTAISAIKVHLQSSPFTSSSDEIHYYKVLFPSIYQHCIYHVELFKLLSLLPPVTQQQPAYWQASLSDIQSYFQQQRELLQYTRSGATHLDHLYFRRQSELPLNFFDEKALTLDASICTPFSYHVSRLRAMERLAAFLEKQSVETPATFADKYTPPLQWTGSKVSLIELIYGLQLAGVFNHATADIKSLVHSFEQLFQVKLGNVYNAFQEMRLRKKNRSPFFDQLKERLVQKMDELDER